MRIAVLGPLQVETDDHAPVLVSGAKERLLLALLAAAAPGVVSTDALAEGLWDGEPPPSAHKSLQAHVVRLRSSLEPGRARGSSGRYVVRRGSGYALAIDRASLDGLLMADLASRGRAALAAGEAAEAEVQLAAAVHLWRGEPYADWPDALFAEPERRRLVEVRTGALAGLLEARLRLGRHADVLPDLERLVAEEPLREEWWRLLMLALYRSGRQADALAAGRRVRGLLADELGAEPGPGLRDMEAAILAQDQALDSPPRPPPAPVGRRELPGSCPYKGLATYQVEDAALFHGRDRLVAALVARLVDSPVLLVSGPSGAGKSSVVRAGLVPALVDGALPGSAAWRAVIVTPGAAPVDMLADLTDERPPDAPVLLVCDQFEELWAPGIDVAERSAFLDAVLGLIDDGVVIRCVIVVRGDHVGRLAEHAAFGERLAGALALVPPLTEPELREIVRGPAGEVGLRVDPELTDAVVGDVLGRAGALPLLSTALVGTWERRRGDLLTLAGYLETGGVTGALTRSAEAAFAMLDEDGQDLARRMFVRLADTDDGGALVRRPLPIAELGVDSDEGAARRRVADVFVDRRLLAIDGDRLEVAHETLLTAWPRLVRWLGDDAAGRVVRRHLAPAARDWDASGRPEDELYRGARLTAALDWAGESGAEVTPLEQQFLEASRDAADAALTAAQHRADREAAGRHRTRRLAVGLAALLVIALVATVLAVRAQQRATEASLVADANRLAALSTTAATPDLSVLLAVQAARLANTPDAQDRLLAALSGTGRAERAVPYPGTPFSAHLAGGRTLFFGTGADVVTWTIDSSTLPRIAFQIPDGWGEWVTAAPSPTDEVVMGAGIQQGGPWLRIISQDGTGRVLLHGDAIGGRPLSGAFTADGRRVRLLVAVPDDADPARASRWSVVDADVTDGTTRDSGIAGRIAAPVGSLGSDFSDDGGSAVLWASPGTVQPLLIDLSNGRQSPVRTPGRPASVLASVALPGGVAQLWDDGAVSLFDRRGEPVQQLDVHHEPVRDILVSPDGTWAVTVGDGPAMILWAVDPETGLWSQREVMSGHVGDVVEVEVDPTGGRLVTVGLDDSIIVWDMSAGGGLGEPVPALEERWISNWPQLVPDGLLVAPTRTGDSLTERRGEGFGPGTLSVAATFIDPTTGEVADEVVVGDTIEGAPFGSSVAVSPDGNRVAVTWGRGATVLDTRTRAVIKRVVLSPDGDPAVGPNLEHAVWSAGWTRDGATLLLGAEEAGGSIVPVDTATWEEGEPLRIGDAAQVIEPSPDGEILAVALESSAFIVILDAETLGIVRTLPLQADDQLTDLSFSADGSMLAGGGREGLLHVFDAQAWEPVREPAAVHNGAMLQVEWLSDGRTIVTAGTDSTVSLFDVERGLVRGRPLRASSEAAEGYSFLVPGTTDELVVLGGDRTGWRYPLDPSVWLEEACAIVGRDLTRAEWDRYLPGRDYEPTCSDLP